MTSDGHQLLTEGCQAKRLVVIGLDCAPPALMFDRFAGELPHLQGECV